VIRTVVACSSLVVLAACGSAPSSAPATSAPTSAPATSAPATSAPTSAPATSDPATSAPATSAPATSDPTSSVPAGQVVVDERGVEVLVESTDRIIPLDGNVAEVVFALGMGDRVVATDLSATYPPEADALPQIGYQRALGIEPILEFEPTLLLATDLAGPPETIDGLERVGVPLVVVPDDPTPTGAAEKIVAIAEALGVADRGVRIASDLQREIDDAIAARPTGGADPRVVSLYVRGASAQLVFGEAYAIHWLIEAAGGDDIADDLGVTESAPITDEAILAAAPDVIVVPASGLESVGGIDGLFDTIPALAQTPAGRARAVLSYDDQLMLGNGPRVGAFLRTLIDDLEPFRPPDQGGARP
jgi:iron complex transport system substrate-binding protein